MEGEISEKKQQKLLVMAQELYTRPSIVEVALYLLVYASWFMSIACLLYELHNENIFDFRTVQCHLMERPPTNQFKVMSRTRNILADGRPLSASSIETLLLRQ